MMPAVSLKELRVYRYVWRRVTLERCAGCDKVIKGMFYYQWTAYYWIDDERSVVLKAKSCLDTACQGQVINDLFVEVPRHAF